jgi:hypothetical protein
MQTMVIEKGAEMWSKGISNIVNKIIAENSPNLNKEMPIEVQEASWTPKIHD